MSNPRQDRHTKKAQKAAVGRHDPLIVELVKLLARSAAEEDYARFCGSKTRPKSKPEARQD